MVKIYVTKKRVEEYAKYARSLPIKKTLVSYNQWVANKKKRSKK